MRDTGEQHYVIGDDEDHYFRVLYPEAYVFAHSRHTFIDLKYHRDQDYSPDFGAAIQLTVTDNENYMSYTETREAGVNGDARFDIGVFLRVMLEGTMQEDTVFDYSENSKAVANHSVTVTLKYYNTVIFTADFEIVNGADEYSDDWWKDERRLHWWLNYPFTFDFRNLDEASVKINSGTTSVERMPQVTPDASTYGRIRINPVFFNQYIPDPIPSTWTMNTLRISSTAGMGFVNGSFVSPRSNAVTLIGHSCPRSEKDIYLRWLNRHGELCYWLFHRYSTQQGVKDNEHIRANVNDVWPESGVIDNAAVRIKTVTKEIKAYTNELDGFDYELVRQVFTAPYVDVFVRTVSANNHVWQRAHVKAEAQTEVLRHADNYTKNRQVVITLLMPEEGHVEL